MSFLQAISPLPREWLIAVAGFTIGVLVLWFCILLSRNRIVVIKKSEETELIAFHLRRIADAAERMSSVVESQSPAEAGVNKHVAMSIFGR